MAEYIERETAKAKIREKFKFVPARIEINEVLNSIPAADVRPVTRGKWDDKPVAFFLKCSECGCCVGHRYDVFLDCGELNFCPNCGADMRPEPPKEE